MAIILLLLLLLPLSLGLRNGRGSGRKHQHGIHHSTVRHLRLLLQLLSHHGPSPRSRYGGIGKRDWRESAQITQETRSRLRHCHGIRRGNRGGGREHGQ